MVALLGWVLVAITAGGAGLVRMLPTPALPPVLFGLTAVVLVTGWRHAGLRAWLAAIDERWLVALHLTRFVGFYFLYLYGRGELPYAFAVPGGWGDIAVASLAAALLLWGPPRDVRRRGAYVAWNVFGLADILFVVATAARLGLEDPALDGGAPAAAAERAADLPGAPDHREPRGPGRAARTPRRRGAVRADRAAGDRSGARP